MHGVVLYNPKTIPRGDSPDYTANCFIDPNPQTTINVIYSICMYACVLYVCLTSHASATSTGAVTN